MKVLIMIYILIGLFMDVIAVIIATKTEGGKARTDEFVESIRKAGKNPCLYMIAVLIEVLCIWPHYALLIYKNNSKEVSNE